LVKDFVKNRTMLETDTKITVKINEKTEDKYAFWRSDIRMTKLPYIPLPKIAKDVRST
jgi:hypothetical protein